MYDQFPQRSVQGGDTGLFAEFFTEAVQNNFKSAEAGRPIFEDRTYVRIVIAGDQKTEVVREASDADKQRFAREFNAFSLQAEGIAQAGTPLKEWPPLTPAMVRNFNAHKVYTVEQLSTLSDGQIQNVGMGAREWRGKAQAFLESASNGAAATAIAAENERLKADLAGLQAQVAELVKAAAKKKTTEAA